MQMAYRVFRLYVIQDLCGIDWRQRSTGAS